MGWYKAKCPQCWDPIPCTCPMQEERTMAIQTSGTAPKLNEKPKKKGGKRGC